ncbi:MAG TPA: CBS domain-containing protein [Candidatus Omnitrophota bacterium]|jgi:CBS domain-containing protein|nr:CBS domain-containing protein [Candidatus Omnitrophota bacterium]
MTNITPRPESAQVKKLLKELKISEVMTSPAVSIRADAHFSDVVRLFNAHRIRHLPVVNEHQKVIGIVSQRDLFKIQSPRRLEDGSWYYDPQELDSIRLSSVMTHGPFVLFQDQSVADALVPMVKFKYGCIPVTDSSEKLVGIITQYDILKMAVDVLNRS